MIPRLLGAGPPGERFLGAQASLVRIVCGCSAKTQDILFSTQRVPRTAGCGPVEAPLDWRWTPPVIDRTLPNYRNGHRRANRKPGRLCHRRAHVADPIVWVRLRRRTVRVTRSMLPSFGGGFHLAAAWPLAVGGLAFALAAPVVVATPSANSVRVEVAAAVHHDRSGRLGNQPSDRLSGVRVPPPAPLALSSRLSARGYALIPTSAPNRNTVPTDGWTKA